MSAEKAIELGEALLDAGFDVIMEQVAYGVGFVGDRAISIRVYDPEEPAIDPGIEFLVIVQQ